MSRRGDAIRARNLLRQTVDAREPRRPLYRALLGDGTSGDPRTHVMVEDNPNRVYVRMEGRGVLEAVWNNKVPPRHDVAVIVGPTQENPDVYEILNVDHAAMDPENDEYRYVPHHHEAHEFRNPLGGDDTVWVQKQQFMPFLANPSDPPDMEIYVQPGFYLFLTDWQYWPGGAVDLTGHGPAAGQVRYVLVSINAVTNTLVMTDGADFAPFPPMNPSAGIPACPAQHFPIVAVYMTDATTEIDWDVMYDVRLMVGGGVNTEVPGPHHLIDATVHDDTVAHHVPVDGDMVVANTDTPPLWDVLAIGAARQILRVNVAADQPEWAAFQWAWASAAVGADMVHDHSTNAEGGQIIDDLNRFSFNPATENIAGNMTNVTYHSYLIAHGVNLLGNQIAGIDTTNQQEGTFCLVQRDDDLWDVGIDHNAALGNRPIMLASGADSNLTEHPILLVLNENDNTWYEIDWTGSAGGAGAHDILSATHGDTLVHAVARGGLVVGNATPLWSLLAFPGDRHHLQTDDHDVIWDLDISMEPDHWIGLGDATGYGTGQGRIVFIEGGGLGRDVMAHLDADVGIGTENPNIAGEAVALTVESAAGAPTVEFSLRDDFLPADQVIGVLRWFSGDVTQCAQGQIDMVQSGWYESSSTMEFWTADECALCLVMDLSCNEANVYVETHIDENLGVGTASPHVVDFPERTVTVAATGAEEQAALELYGNITTDTVISTIIFLNEASSYADKRVAQISAYRDGDDDAASLYFAVWDSLAVPNAAMIIGSDSDVTLSGAIAATHGNYWALEDYHAGAPTADGYVRVDIDGVERRLLTYTPP
jgi:hypothetical protein